MPLYQHALDVYEKELGPEHPDVSKCLNNIAYVYSETKKYQEALKYYNRSLYINEKTLGTENTDFATTLMNLATLHQQMGKYEESVQTYHRALSILEKVVGKENYYVAIILTNMATLYNRMGLTKDSLSLYLQALDIYMKIFDSDHPSIAKCFERMADLYYKLGNKEKEDSLKLDLTSSKLKAIKKIVLENYREYPTQKEFEFSKINLIFGENGSGKTSLLEAIELFICGKNLRHPDKNNDNTSIKVLFEGESDLEQFNPKDEKIFELRDALWYNNLNQGSNLLYLSFNRFNYYNSDAAFRLNYEESSGRIKEVFENFALGGNINNMEKRLIDYQTKLESEINKYDKDIKEWIENLSHDTLLFLNKFNILNVKLLSNSLANNLEFEIEKTISLFNESIKVTSHEDKIDIGSINKNEVKKDFEKLKILLSQREKVQHVSKIILDILRNNSKEKYLHEFSEQNKNDISKIFNIIHTPEEFESIDFDNNSNIILKRKGSNDISELSSISTG